MFVQLTKDVLGNAPGKRIDVSEEHGKLLIQQGVAEAVGDDPLGPLVAKSLEQALGQLSDGVQRGVNAALEKVADVQSQARQLAIPAIFGAGRDGDPRKNFGDWCLAVARGDRNYLEKHYGSHFVEYAAKAAMAEASGVTGGYTVPPDFQRQIMDIVAEQTFLRPRAFVQPMASATMQFPYLDITTTQAAGVSPLLGGVQMAWTEEAQNRTETEPAFKMLELKAHELSGYSISSNAFLQDNAFGLERFLYTLFGKAIAWFEEFAFLQGNGIGKPLGILNANASVAVNRSGANQVQFVDVATMYAKLLPVSVNNAIWVHSPSVIPQLLQLKDGANRAIFISIDQGSTKRPAWSLLGLPTFCTEKVPALGTKGDFMLIDPSFYIIGDRMQIEIAASEHVNFLKNQTTWRVVERVDGQPWMDKPITLQDGATQVSPFVVLN